MSKISTKFDSFLVKIHGATACSLSKSEVLSLTLLNHDVSTKFAEYEAKILLYKYGKFEEKICHIAGDTEFSQDDG